MAQPHVVLGGGECRAWARRCGPGLRRRAGEGLRRVEVVALGSCSPSGNSFSAVSIPTTWKVIVGPAGLMFASSTNCCTCAAV